MYKGGICLVWNSFHQAMLGVGQNQRMTRDYVKEKGLTEEEIAQCINEGLLRYNRQENSYCLTAKGFDEVWR